MINLNILLAILSVGSSPLLAVEPSPLSNKTEVVLPQQVLGSQAIDAIREGFENGNYDSFLKELDDSYKGAVAKNQLTQLVEMREGVFEHWKEWETKAQNLQKEKNKELIRAVEDEDPSPFKEKVLSAASNPIAPEQEEALFKIASFRQMAPGSGANEDENRLIDLDLEYEYKALHLAMPGASSANLKEKQIVLRMEKEIKMIELASSFQDASLKKAVDLYAQNLNTRLAQIWDAVDLNALANGKEKIANAAEEKVALILNQYQEKFGDLAKQLNK